jgi:histidine triad (HIT) family protein
VTVADDCLFCRIVRKEIPAKLVAEDEHCVAFRDINPQAPVHVLVIPRAHVPSLNQATDAAMIGRLSLMAAEIARSEGVAESGYRTVINTNAGAGQTVFHVHLHLLGGRALHWPPG